MPSVARRPAAASAMVAADEAQQAFVGALEPTRAALQDAPLAFHLDCGVDFVYAPQDGELSHTGKPVFGVAASGKLLGLTAKAVLHGYKEGVALCRRSLKCTAFAVLPYSIVAAT